MACVSADAARRWRAQHLAAGRIRPGPGPSARTLVDRGHELRDLAAIAHNLGRFDLVADALRLALRAVPEPHRLAVRLAHWLRVALVGRATWHAVIDEDLIGFRAAYLGPADAEPVAMGTGVYGFASGEFAP